MREFHLLLPELLCDSGYSHVHHAENCVSSSFAVMNLKHIDGHLVVEPELMVVFHVVAQPS